MTTLSLNIREAMAAEATGAVPICLLTFTHPDLDTPLRASSDPTTRISIDPLVYGTVSRSLTFLWVPMSPTMPGDDDKSPPQISIVLDALDRSIFAVIRASTTPAVAKLEIVLDTSPDIVEMALDNFKIVTAPYDESQITLALSQESFWGEPWPAGHMTPLYFPGLFP